MTRKEETRSTLWQDFSWVAISLFLRLLSLDRPPLPLDQPAPSIINLDLGSFLTLLAESQCKVLGEGWSHLLIIIIIIYLLCIFFFQTHPGLTFEKAFQGTQRLIYIELLLGHTVYQLEYY